MPEIEPFTQNAEFLAGLWAVAFTYFFGIFSFLIRNLYIKRSQSRLNHIYIEHSATRFIETLEGSLIELKALKERLQMSPRQEYFAHLNTFAFDKNYSTKPMRGAFMMDAFNFEMDITGYNALVDGTNESLGLCKGKWIDAKWPPDQYLINFISTLQKTIDHLNKVRTRTIEFLSKARITARRTVKLRILPVNFTNGWPFFFWSRSEYTVKERILFELEEKDLKKQLGC